jgi:hypothetical protein
MVGKCPIKSPEIAPEQRVLCEIRDGRQRRERLVVRTVFILRLLRSRYGAKWIKKRFSNKFAARWSNRLSSPSTPQPSQAGRDVQPNFYSLRRSD